MRELALVLILLAAACRPKTCAEKGCGDVCGADRAGTELYCNAKGACVPRQVFCIKAPCPPVLCP